MSQPMVTTDRVASLVRDLVQFEREVRDVLHDQTAHPDETTAAFAAMRQTIALRKPLEKWIATRACRTTGAAGTPQ